MSVTHQLSLEQRYQISTLKETGLSQSAIADMIGVHKSTISRELRRNTGGRGYRPKQAHRFAAQRRKGKSKARISLTTWRQVEDLIKLDWSPEQISLRISLEEGIRISHEWIYQYIYRGKKKGGHLHTHLRCQKKRRKRYGTYDRRGKIPYRVSIDERPDVVDKQERIGDWEGDTIIGRRHKGVIVSMVERKSLFTVLGASERKRARDIRKEILKALAPLKGYVHTITFDNGKEFSEHVKIASALGADIYFAHPYTSWERGVNENTNGLVRQYFPKAMDFTEIRERDIRKVMDRLNHRPRKKLGGKTPYEVFFNTSTTLIPNVALTS